MAEEKYISHHRNKHKSTQDVVRPCKKAQNWEAYVMCSRNKEGFGTTSHSEEVEDGESGGGAENQNPSCDMANPQITRHRGRESLGSKLIE